MGVRQRRRLAVIGLGFAATLAACGPPRPGPGRDVRLYEGPAGLAGMDARALRGRRILIDPGHGGRYAGAAGAGGTREADVNLGVGLYLWGLLRDAGADVHLTRSSDRSLDSLTVRDDLAARVHAIDSLAPEVFLSLHHNSTSALDRERNAVETYYKLDDDGPSYDLGRAIAAELGRRLGIDAARLVPGNYFVLRGARAAAVLGEASYLSNPRVESRLRLASAQRLEAEAYFHGLVDYFARGTAALEKIAPAGDTLGAGDGLAFAAGRPLDPLAASLGIDGVPVEVRVDAGRGTIACDMDLAPGAHRVEVRARLLGGNAARPWSGTLVVQASPAEVAVQQEPAIAAPDAPLRLRVAVRDARGRALGDGTPVRLGGDGLEILDAEATLRQGEVRAIGRGRGVAPRLRVECGTLVRLVPIAVRAGGEHRRLVRCIDARLGLVVEGASLEPGGRTSDRTGWVALGGGDTLQVQRRGYAPWRGTTPAGDTLRLEPLYDGALHDVVVVLDPGGDGGGPALPGTGVAAADVAQDLCRLLGEALHAAGARPIVTRGPADAPSDLERVRLATRVGAAWYVRVDAVPAGGAAVLHYPGSAGGETLARAVGAALLPELGGSVPVRADARFVLQQTPCPAAVVELPLGRAVSLGAARGLAAALVAGLRAALDAGSASLPPLVGRIAPPPPAAALVILDDALALPVGADGTFRFERVTSGTRRLRVVGAVSSAAEVVVSGRDTTRVTLVPAAPRR